MSATNKTLLSADPETGMSASDAILLAVRNWIWLVVVPPAIALVASLAYTNLPTRTTVTAVLNANLDVVELYAKPIIEGLDPATTVTLTEASGTTIITAEAPDGDTAQALTQQIIDATPQPDQPKTSLSAAQSLELRALREYLISVQSLLTTGPEHSAESNALKAEMALVQERIDYLELRDVAPQALPKVAQEPRATPIRQPPMRNVAVFTLLFTLFVAWMIVYGRERRRITREKATL